VEQAKLLHRYTEKVVLLYDGDSAGVDAAVRAARIIISRDLEAEIVAMPREHDPDSLLRDKKRPEFDRLPRLSVFDFHLRQAGGIPETRPEREALAREMLETASCLPGEMKRSLALEEISEKLKMPVDALRSELRHLRRDKKDDVEDHIETTTLQFAPSEIVERDLVKILIALPELGEEVFPTLNPDLISHPTLKKIFTSMKSLYLKGEMKDAHNLLPQYEDSAMLNFIAESAFWEIPGEPEVLLRDYVAKMQNRNVRSETTEIRRKIKEAEAKGEDINYLLKRLREMQKKARI
jgi:DNA primase